MMVDSSAALRYTVSGDLDEQVGEDFSDQPRLVVVSRPMPFQLMRRYAELAVRDAEFKSSEDEEWIATIPGFQGVWAAGETEDAAAEELRIVIYEWTTLKRQMGDDDLPIVEGIDLNI